MIEAKWLRGALAAAFLLVSSVALAQSPYTSVQSGDWNDDNTWSGTGIPVAGDQVTITNSHTVTVTGLQTASRVTLQGGLGSKTLVINSGGNLDLGFTGNALQVDGSSDGTNMVELNGGSITANSGSINVNAPSLTLARIHFTTSGGTLSALLNLTFSGTPSNAQVLFDAGSPGIVQIGGTLGSGGSITTNGSGTFRFNGVVGQTINGYTFNNLEINKVSSTATLNGPITVNRDLSIVNGVLDDGGNQIALNVSVISTVSIGTNGVLKLGSSGVTTFFPTPVNGANVTMSPNAAVVYQAGQTGQIVDLNVTYRRLFMQAPGSTGPVDKMIGSGTLKVQELLQVDDNGANDVRLVLGPETLDVDGDIIGSGEILVTSGSIFVGGTFATTTLSLAGTTSTVTYDGPGAQNVLPTTYDNLTVNKASGQATLLGPVMVNKDLTIMSGTLDDAGYQISLDSGLGSMVNMGTFGILQLGSSTSATTFPAPVNPANVNLAVNSQVTYQSGQSQSIDTSFDYKKLSLTTLGGAVVRSFVNQTFLTVLENFFVGSNVTASFDNDILDVDGGISGNGTIQLVNSVSPGDVKIGGHWVSSVDLVAANGTTVTYDGIGNQDVLGDTYSHLAINKPGGTASLIGTAQVNGTFTNTAGSFDMVSHPLNVVGSFTNDGTFGGGTNTLTLQDDFTNNGSFAGNAGTVLLMGTGAQNWGGSAPAALNDLTSQNPVGLFFNESITVFDFDLAAAGNATVTPGKKISVLPGGSIANGGGAFIIGSLEQSLDSGVPRNFPVGTAAGSANVEITPAANGTITVDAVAGANPNATGSNLLSRYWKLSNVSGFANADLAFHYNVADVTGTESNYILGRWISSWSQFGAVDSVNHKATKTNASGLAGDWTAGEPASLASPSTLTVTSILDSGPGTLRDAITTVNAGGCTAPCMINFDVNGTGNIVLATPLPALTANAANLTIDGYSGFGASVNSAIFGSPSDAIITVSLDGNNTVAVGLEIQTNFVTIQGIAFRNFSSGGLGEAIKINNGANNVISGCYIGTDNSGTTPSANYNGIVIIGAAAANNTIGGPSDDSLNVISGNTTWGIVITGGANNTDVKKNYIGVAATAATGLGNGNGGVYLDGDFNKIGSALTGNIISGHSSAGVGVRILGVDNELKRNFIGLDGAGSAAIPNTTGLVIIGNDNYIGGVVADRNYISGNLSDGISISGNDNIVSNNYIGLDNSGGTPIPNGGNGILIGGTSAGNEIGLPLGNAIDSNNGRGINLSTTGIGTAIRQNKIRNNTGIAIDLGNNGLTANDATDSDSGTANNAQNFPIIGAAAINGGNVDVTASINSSGGVSVGGFLVDVYAADTSTPSQAGDYLGASGCIAGSTFTNQVISVPNAGLVAGSKVVVTATAFSDGTCTTVTEGTSELSPSFTLTGDIHWIAGTGSFENPANWSPAVVPGPGDTAYIDAAGTYTVTMSATHTVGAIHIGAVSGTQLLDLASGTTLTINAPSSITTNGVLTLDGNLLTGGGSLDVNGVMNWATGNIGGVAALNVNSGGTLNLNSGVTKTLADRLLTVNASGTVNWTGGNVLLATGGAINNGGLFLITADWVLQNSGGGGAFTNTGTGILRKTTTVGTTIFTGVALNLNSGTLDLDNGTLDLATATLAASVDLAAATELLINDNSVAVNSGSSFPGTGLVHVNGGTLNVNTPASIRNVTLDTGIIDGTSTLAIPSGGLLTWNGGTMQGGGTTQITSGGSVQINGASVKLLSQRTLQLLSGSIGGWSDGILQLSAGGNVDNAGLFTITGNTPLTNSGAGGFVIQPTGTLRKSTGALTTQFSNTTLTNNGTLDIQTGTFDPATFNNAGTVSINGGAVLLVNSDVTTYSAGSAASGAGSLQITAAQLTINASLNLPKLQIDGGTVDGTGTFTCDNLAWGAGLLSGSGTTQISGGQSMFIATAAPKTLSRALSVLSLGNVTVNGTGTLNVGVGGSINNGGLFLVTADMNIAGSGQTITNSGTFRKSTGTGTLVISNLAFDNSNILDVQNGIVDLASGTSTGSFLISTTCEVLINSDSYNLSSGSSVTGAGKLKLVSGSLVVSGAAVQVDNYQQLGGFLGGTGQLQVLINGDWGGGTMQSGGSTLINGAFSLSGAAAKLLDTRTFSIGATGIVTLNGTGSVTLANGGNIANNGNFIATADNTFNNGGTAGIFDNTGTFTKQTTTGATTFSNVGFTNHNIVDLQSGILSVTGPFTQTSGTFKLKFGGTAPGTQYAQLQTVANPSLAGTLQVLFNGPYEPNPGDTFLAVQIATGAHSGVFTPSYPAMCCGKTWSENYGATGLLLTVSGVADLTISKSAPSNVIAGNPISYTLTVNNTGPDPATAATVTDVLQTGHSSIVPNGGAAWNCGVLVLTVTCTANANLATGPAQSITINANAPTALGPFTNVANVTSTNDPNGGNNSGSAIVTVDPPNADLAVSANAAPSPAPTATPVSFTFTLLNNGPAPATGVTFSAPVPAGLTFTGSVPTGPTCTFSAGTLSCNLGTIPSGNNTSVTINATTNAGGTQTITGTASRAETDPNPANDSASASVLVTGGASLTVINTNDSGSGSLRQAILDANSGSCTAPCTIGFNIPGGPPFVIAPIANLPTLAVNATIDAATQPGYAGSPIVKIDGTNTRSLGLAIAGNGATVRGLSITRTTTSGLSITGNSNTVEACWIGLNPGGVAEANVDGIVINGNLNVIGGTGSQGNTIANNTQDGVALITTATGATILGNSFFNNGDLAIDIAADGPTSNDSNDADAGPNGKQNFPNLTDASIVGSLLHIAWNIDSSGTAAQSLRFEFYRTDGAGEGKDLIGGVCLAGNALGAGTNFPLGSVTAGNTVVGTATSYSDTSCTTVLDGTSEFTSTPITVTTCTPPSAAITAPPSVCSLSTGNSASVPVTAGATYAWIVTNGTITSAANAPSITFTAGSTGAANLSVTVTDSIGCSSNANTNVTIAPLPSVTITGPTATCALSPVTLDAGGGFASYSWNTGAMTQQITVSPASTATYTVTVANGSGCSAMDSHTVTVSANPTATITAPVAVCANTTGNTASVPVQAGATYAWSIGNGTITSGAAAASIAFTAGASGSVTLSVTITVGSCTSNGSVNVPIVAAPVANITGPTQVCPSSSFVLDAGPGFASYLWSNGAVTQTIAVAQAVPSATYSVTVSNGSCQTTDSHVVTLLPTPNVAITAPANALPDTAGLVASVPVTPSATHIWTITNGTITSAANGNSITFTAGSSGTTTLNLSSTLGSCTVFAQHFVGITAAANDEADLGITKSAATSVQAGGTLVYTLGVTNAGPDIAGDVLIVDTLPAGTTLVSIDDGPWNCFAVLSHVNCTGTAFVGENTFITIAVTAPQQGGAITNSVTISATIPDPNPSNDSASATTNVIAAPATCATVPPSLLAPANNASATSPVTFSWSAVDGATEYDLWLVNNGLTSLAGSTANTSLMRQVPSGTTSWFVIARFSGGCSPLRSAQRTFNVAEGGNCAGHGTPQITSPAAGANVSSPVNFSWTPVPQAIGYRIWIEVNGTAAQDIGTTDGAISLTAAVPPGSIVAFVDALFAGCPATRSQRLAFTVPRPDPCAARSSAGPFAPANDATINSSSVDFQWSAAAGADGYRVWFSQDGATPAVLGTTTNETSLHATFGPGVVVWWIESLYEGCASTESTRLRFTIPQSQGCSTTAPTPIAPQNGSVAGNGEVTFTWTSVPGAISYELWLAAAKGTPSLLGTTTGTSLTRILGPGELEWFVRVTVDRCPPRDSQLARFTLQPPAGCLGNQRPIAISPIEGAGLSSPVDFSWHAPAGATLFELLTIRGNGAPQLAASTSSTQLLDVNLAAGNLRWFVRAHFNGCASLDSEERELEIVAPPAACAPLAAPVINAPGQISSGVPFLIQWTPVAGATAYQLQLSGDAGFASAETITTTATQHELTRTSTVYARVRALDGSCHPVPTISAFGPSAAIFILPQQGSEGAAPLTGGIVTFTIPIGAQFAGQTFTATTHDPWLSVAPASGIVGPSGTNLIATANTTGLPVGSSLGAVTITLSTPSSNGVQSQGTTVSIPNLSVSLVTPVTPSPKSSPPPDALVIPAVAHADGINSKFQSDVRVSNTSPQLLKYQLTYTPSGGAGISAGKQTIFSIEPGRTVALDDILKSWFGTGSESSVGTLEIRPMTQTSSSTSSAAFSGLANLVTFASSRTFNLTTNGTFGQYIPAVPYANFIGRALDLTKPTLLSLQQIAQSDRYRTNLGIVEGSGAPASLLVSVFGDAGEKLTEFPVNLAGGEHTQLNGFLAQHGISSLADGRVEIQVLSPGGKVTAYASVLDNQTSDPLLVTPVTLTDTGASRWVVPGVADLNNGFANWQTDMRIFNAGTAPVDALLSFYSQSGGPAKTANITIPAGQVRQLDKTLASVFGVTNDGGAVHLTTASATRLITTARTYNQTTGGTYGQFISAVTPAEAAGVGGRPLQILQVEESTRFRSNIGLAEVTGNAVTIEIAVVPPDAKFTAVTQLTLQPNEFRQIGSLLKTVGLDGTFNARVTVRAIGGTGRVTAYASVIDALTNDPTYVPAQ